MVQPCKYQQSFQQTSLACLVLRGLATLNLEAASIPARMYLYLDPYNESEGMYNSSSELRPGFQGKIQILHIDASLMLFP